MQVEVGKTYFHWVAQECLSDTRFQIIKVTAIADNYILEDRTEKLVVFTPYNIPDKTDIVFYTLPLSQFCTIMHPTRIEDDINNSDYVRSLEAEVERLKARLEAAEAIKELYYNWCQSSDLPPKPTKSYIGGHIPTGEEENKQAIAKLFTDIITAIKNKRDIKE